jgi:TonB-linked SusC/RagA family outer membrane protein
MYKIYTNVLYWPVHGRFSKPLLVMKLTLVFIIATLVQVSASSFAQKINLTQKHVTLKQVFKEIKKQAGYDVLYQPDKLDAETTIDANFTDATVDEVMTKCLSGKSLIYTLFQKSIVIREKEEKPMEKPASTLPPRNITGKVLDETGQPLPGATIKIKGRNVGVLANEKGEFTLPLETDNAVLVISFIGCQKREIPVDAKTPYLNISLERSLSKLDEVHIIGYGTTTERLTVGSQSKITAEEIANQPVGNILEALDGRLPGVVITPTTGLPGGMVNIQIRGQNTLNPNMSTGVGTNLSVFDQPLFIVDGVPLATQNANIIYGNSTPSMYSSVSGIGNGPAGISALSNINPNDVESIEVLKDADATSIYGSRGANGVVLITTKRGKAGKVVFNGDFKFGESVVTRTMELMNTQQYLEMRNEAFKNDGVTPTLANAPDLLVYDQTASTDWKKYWFTTASNSNVNIALSGGTNENTFYIGGNYNHSTTIFPGPLAYDGGAINASFSHISSDKKLSVAFNTIYSYVDNHSTVSSVINPFSEPPNYPISSTQENPDGSLIWQYKGLHIGNSLATFLQKAEIKTEELNDHLEIGYRILRNLNFSTSFGYNEVNNNYTYAIPSTATDPSHNPTGSAQFNNSVAKTWIVEPQFTYEKRIGQGKLNAVIGGTLQQSSNTGSAESASGYTNDALLGSLVGATTVSADRNSSQAKYASVFGRLGYTLQDKYILSLTGRRDGSSTFGPGKQYGNFGAVGAGWIFSEESLFKNVLPFINFGKVRGSYGTTGTPGSDYQYLSLWSISNGTTSYQGNPVYNPQNLSNQDYSWAVNKKLDFGLELGFLQNQRFLLTIDWYRNRCSNQLVNYILPIQTGFSNVYENFPAVVQNSGMEFSLNAAVIKSKEFNWSSNFSLAFAQNKLIAFPGIENTPYSHWYRIGSATTVIWGSRYAGVNPTTGVYQFYTPQGGVSSSTSSHTYEIIGDVAPKFSGGWRNSFAFKTWKLDIFLSFKKQIGQNFMGQIGAPGSFGNMPTAVLNRWQKPGDNAQFEQYTQNSGSAAALAYATIFQGSDAAYTDASYIRVQTVSFSYGFPQHWLQKLGLQGLVVSLEAQNLFTITNYMGNDPEARSWGAVPLLKTTVAKIRFGF